MFNGFSSGPVQDLSEDFGNLTVYFRDTLPADAVALSAGLPIVCDGAFMTPANAAGWFSAIQGAGGTAEGSVLLLAGQPVAAGFTTVTPDAASMGRPPHAA